MGPVPVQVRGRGRGRFREGAEQGEGYKPDQGSPPPGGPLAAPGSGRLRPRAHPPHPARVPTLRPAARPPAARAPRTRPTCILPHPRAHRTPGRGTGGPVTRAPALAPAPETRPRRSAARPAHPHSLPPPPASPSRQLGARRTIPEAPTRGREAAPHPADAPAALRGVRPHSLPRPSAPHSLWAPGDGGCDPRRQRQRRSWRPPGPGTPLPPPEAPLLPRLTPPVPRRPAAEPGPPAPRR